MAKISLPTVTDSTNISTINANFQAIAEEFNNKALYRTNPVGEPNQMSNDLDMNSNDILNTNSITTEKLILDGKEVTTLFNSISLGFSDYADTSTQTTPQSIPAGVWTTLSNDGLGTTSTGDTFLPKGVTSLYDGTTNTLDFSGLSIGAQLRLRYDFEVTPSINNTSIAIRINFVTPFFSFPLTSQLPRLDSGAGIAYPEVNDVSFYIGSQEVLDGTAEVQVFCDNPVTVKVNGYYIGIGKDGN